MCHISRSTAIRAIGALTLLCIYISVVLLSFTRNEHGGTSGSLTWSARVQSPNSQTPHLDRTYCTSMTSEDQLPSLLTLAYSLMEQESQYGLLVLIPTGKPKSTTTIKRRRQTSTTTTKIKSDHDRSDRLHKKTKSKTRKRHSTLNFYQTTNVDETPLEWSEEALAIMRAIPNLTIQELPHIQFPPPSSTEPQPASASITEDPDPASTVHAPTVTFASAVSTLLMFEVWHLTSYKQVLYLDIQTVLNQNIDHLLQTNFAKRGEAKAPSTVAPHPEVYRNQTIDYTVEHWLNVHSLKGSTVVPIDWSDTHASMTQSYLQIAAPMQLTRDDCAREEEVNTFISQTNNISSINMHNPFTPIPTTSPLFASSLDWSLFAGGIVLLTPNAYTYHLLLSRYTNTHIEQRDRFDRGNAQARAIRHEKFRDYPANFLNHFFSEPCAHSLEGHQQHHHISQGQTNRVASNSPLASDTDGGCWHPLQFNFSLTSHTCSCETGSFNPGVINYATCGSSSRSIWSALPSNIIEILRRCDQLVIQPSDEDVDVRSVIAGATKSNQTTYSSKSSKSNSYYSKLLSSLSWLSSISGDVTSHRYAHLYLNELEQTAFQELDRWLLPSNSSASTPVNSSNQLTPAPISSCCHQRYRSTISEYMEALRIIRPIFKNDQGS